MTRIAAMVLMAWALVGCVPGGGRGGGGDDDGGVEGDGDLDPADLFVDPDDGIPPGDMLIDPDDGIPPVDGAVESDTDIPTEDMGDVPDGCVADAESCNGIDDDCDGFADEDFAELGGGCEVGEGLCAAAGELVCDAGGGGTVCSVRAGAPADEVCNGLDDDCDGIADEGADGGACPTGAPGRCSAGQERCLGGEPVCLPDLDPGEEVCNDADDDCDGAVDEGDVCDACADVQCPDRFYCRGGECFGLPPTEENCVDGIDDDGDGFVDCADFDCDDPVICAGLQEFDCDNQVDEDENGFVDCDDFACDDDPICQVVLGEECADYVEIDDGARNAEAPDGSACDEDAGSTLAFGVWVRFRPPAGVRLIEAPVPDNTCGTDAAGWLVDGHPQPADGIVERRVCFSWRENECRWESLIEVRDCGAFYVYRFERPPACSLQYCVE